MHTNENQGQAVEVSDKDQEQAEWRRRLLSPELLEVGRMAIQEALIDFRDEHISTFRGNGMVIRNRDGSESSAIRFGPEDAIRIGLRAMFKALNHQVSDQAFLG